MHLFKIKIILPLLIYFFAACATTNTTSPHHGRQPVNTRTPVYQHALDSEENTKNSSPASPLIQEGIAHLEQESTEQAEWKFEEAINLDPDYGPSYYWLARARFKLKEIDQAMELLDQAKALLKNSEVWLKRIEEFRSVLKGGE